MDGGIEIVSDKLPGHCISREPTTGKLVVLTRGKQGFRYMTGDKVPGAYNRSLGLTYEQVEAMEYGALFGFEAELADPAHVRRVREELGLPVGPIQAAVSTPAPAVALAAKKPPSSALPEELGNFMPWFRDALAQNHRS